MKHPIILASAALLAFISPSIGAEIVQTQTLTSPLHSVSGGPLNATNALGSFGYFDPALGSLSSVIFQYNGIVNASVSETTLFQTAEWTPKLELTKQFVLAPVGFLFDPTTYSATGPTQTLTQNKLSTFSNEFSVSFTQTFTGAGIAPFINASPTTFVSDDQSRLVAVTFFGGSGVSASGTEKLTYVFTPRAVSVPEPGSLVGMLGFGLAGVAFVGRNRRKG